VPIWVYPLFGKKHHFSRHGDEIPRVRVNTPENSRPPVSPWVGHRRYSGKIRVRPQFDGEQATFVIIAEISRRTCELFVILPRRLAVVLIVE
jgi:hypothetical protein